MSDQRTGINRLAEQLEAKKGTKSKMIIGLDGFVDEIIHVVDKRQDFNSFTRINTISEFGSRIQKAAGLSANIEFVTSLTKLGGNGPILSNALIEYGVRLTYIGALGKSGIHPVFKQMAENSDEVYSMSDPGHTDALEFQDGKLMLGKLTTLNDLTWKRFKEIAGEPTKIAAMIDSCDLFGMENWTMIPYMNEIWQGLIDEVFPLMKTKTKPFSFFDLADPEKRTKEDILDAMKLIGDFEKKFKTILGLNEKELYEIAEVYGISSSSNFLDTVKAVYDKLGIYCLVVHPTKEAAACVNGELFRVEGPYCAKPVLTTGAGDNFNAGFCFGQALGLDAEVSLLLGVATSGFYVRNARSPKYSDMLGFLKDWAEAKI